MNAVAKFLSAAAVAAGLSAAPAAAQPAVPPPLTRPVPYPPAPWHPPRVDYDFAVYVRSPHGHWRYYGAYETRRQAEWTERRLEARGYRAKVVPFRDGPVWASGR